MAAYDDIAYCKGGSIITYIRFILGEAGFQRFLNEYLTAFAYGSVESDDLWSLVGTEYSCWSKLAGYPVVLVTKNDDNIIVKQEGPDLWTICIDYMTERGDARLVLQ